MNKIVVLILMSIMSIRGGYALTEGDGYAELNESDANIIGHVLDKNSGEHLAFINVFLKGTTIGTTTDETGHYFLKNLPEGHFKLEFSSIGYKTLSKEVVTVKGKTLEVNAQIEEDYISLEGIVVSANRNETKRRMAPTLVKVIGPQMFEATTSCNLSQGMKFQPGVRVENDCQNCGYTQVRINGMDGKYTQILIDSHPIFSALAGVYGLEQIPTNMVERVEVMRGGGSALFGSSAIAGTVNIITKEPLRNSASLSHTLSNYDGSSTFENNTAMNLSLVTDDHKAGIYMYGQNRYRSPWDKNDDGFSELPKLRNTTVGMKSFYKFGPYSKMTFEYHHMEEFRRGGNAFEYEPHIAEDAELNGMNEPGLVEQIRHYINSGSVSFDLFSSDQKHHLNLFASAQDIDRESYYSAYGKTDDLTSVIGAQYVYSFDQLLFMPSDFTIGTEYNADDMKDRSTDIPLYRDEALAENAGATGQVLTDLIEKYTPDPLNQKVKITSAYAQNEWKNKRWSFLFGARVDKHNMVDHAIFSPRANIRYNPTENLNFRMSYAEGFRAPQAFDEDLHISNVGGERVLIQRSPDLKEERSRSVNGSIDWYFNTEDFQYNFLAEGFYTNLSDPFVLSAPVEVGNELMKTRTNGSGSKVYGATLEGKMAYRNLFRIQAGITLQKSKYDEPEEWSADEDHLSASERVSDRILRTPNTYGYFTATYTPTKPLSISMNGNYTGEMLVPHLLSDVNGTADQLINSPSFFELGMKVSYEIKVDRSLKMQLNAGVKNLFNSFQDDFDSGASRDSGFIYGPGTPRAYFAGVKFSY